MLCVIIEASVIQVIGSSVALASSRQRFASLMLLLASFALQARDLGRFQPQLFEALVQFSMDVVAILVPRQVSDQLVV